MGELRLKSVYKYYAIFSQTCDIGEPHNTRLFCYASRKSERHGARTEDYYSTLELEEVFMVPRLEKFHESQNRIKKYQLVEAFISFLLQLLHPEINGLDLRTKRKRKDLIENLEKELRFLLTILGDTSLMFLFDDEHEEFQELLVEFEAVANEAASLVRSLLFSYDRASLFFCIDREFGRMKEGLGVVLDHIDLLKTNIMEFLNLPSSISRSACLTPKTSVVDSLLIVDSLIYDLEDIMNREDNPVADVKDQIERLHQGLTLVQSSIKHIGSRQPSEIGELKEPLMRIGDMAHQAEYLIIAFLVGDAPLWYLVTRFTDINNKIELSGTELQEITKKYKFGDLSKVPRPFSARLSLQAKENAEVDDVTVGFEDKVRDILDKLVGGTERLQVISIFGMPGLGKTTLAKKLYNHPTVNYWFDKLSWCVVSQTYLRQRILTDILIHIESEFEKDRILKMEEERLVEGIYKNLKGRRYLVVMDDIWDPNVWVDLRRCFPDDGNGSRILFTTRNRDVAPPFSEIYAQPSLSKDQCWELLEKKVFHEKSSPPELLWIGRKIAANCRGLPLAVIVIAGVLSTMDMERRTWEEVQRNLASYIFDGGEISSVTQILELSYKHLPDYLKPCFLYFGAFEEDKEIPARNLMRLWIAEGFVRRKEDKRAENVAEEYLMELIDKSLVMVARRRSDGGVKACIIHDLLRDLCFKICEEEKFLKFETSNIGSFLHMPETRRQSVGEYESWSYCQHIRSFHGNWLTSRLYVRDMRLLRVLAPHYRFEQLIGIEYLVNLKYLVINADYLHASIGRLVNLEYLRVELKGTYGRVVYLPPAIVKMRKLRYIHILSGNARYHQDCIGSSQPNKLEHLSGIIIDEPKDEEVLKCSPRLHKLKCKSGHSFLNFDFLTQLESLNVGYWGDRLVEEISFPANIKRLTLSSFTLIWEKISIIIGRLENLEVLKLEYIDASAGGSWDTRDGEFQKLKFLKLHFVNLSRWNIVDSSQHFPRLQRLVLSNCHNLKEIPSEIGEIVTLQLIEVKGLSPRSLVESAKRIQQEQWDEMGNEDLRVIISTN